MRDIGFFNTASISEILGSIVAPDLAGCTYTVARTPAGEYVYSWGPALGCGEVPSQLLNAPEAMAGAMVGKKEEIEREIRECVGSFRDWGSSEQATEATRVVDFLLSRI